MRAGQPRVGVQAAARERLEGPPGQDPAPRGGEDAAALERLVSVRERVFAGGGQVLREANS